MLRYLIDRLKEPSTMRGFVNFVTGAAATVGIVVKPEFAEQIIAAGLALVGMLGMLVPDAKPEPKE